jgi:hypothetical protein
MASNYDSLTHIRKIAPDQWKDQDGPVIMKLQESEETWLRHFMAVELSPNVPFGVQRLFEECRGAMVYSWFYYPLASLGMAHCFRVLELAAKLRAEKMNPKTFEGAIKSLVANGIIIPSDEQRWHAARKLRNSSSHPEGKTLNDPGQALSTLRTTQELIHVLYPKAETN